MIKNRELQKVALAHYTRLMKVITTFGQVRESVLTFNDTRSIIESAWGSEFCVYCHQYDQWATGMCENSCPLNLKKNRCCAGMWRKMDCTTTWSKWYLRAYIVRMYIAAHGHKEINNEQ